MKRTVAWLLIGAPAAPFLGVALAATIGWIPDDWYYLQGDVSALAFTLAVLVAGHSAFLVWRAGVGRRRVAQATVAAEQTAALKHGAFLEHLEHELRNPLAGVRSELDALRAAAPGPPQQQALEAIDAQVRRVDNLITDLGYLTDMRARPLLREPVPVEALVREVVSFVHQERAVHTFTAGGGQIDFENKVAWELPAIAADREILLVALYNVIANACKFTGPQGQVKTKVGQEGDWITVEVIDTGRGIPRDDLAQVGRELHRATNARDLPGHGLGLATARAAVERHGGSLDVQSREKKGTVVTIRLPAGGRAARGQGDEGRRGQGEREQGRREE